MSGDAEREYLESQESSIRIRQEHGLFGRCLFILGVSMSLFHVYVLGFNPITPWILYNIHLAFGVILIVLLYPATGKSPTARPSFLDAMLVLFAVASASYLSITMEELIYRIGVAPTAWDIFFSCVLIVVAIEATRRTTGPILPSLAIFGLLYARFGNCLPGILGHRGYDWGRIITHVAGFEGIFGTTLAASAQFVFLPVLFSAFLYGTGAGEFFIDLSLGLAGGVRGGPAKVAVVASALFGTISGNSVANVVSTGAFTIPMMKQMGYQSEFAGATEAAASTGGQLMPPIMGAAAFIMAQLIGKSYPSIIAAAVLPALIYFFSIYTVLDLEACRHGLKGIRKDQLPSVKRIMRLQGYLLIPLLVLILLLVVFKTSLIRACLWAIASVVVVNAFRPDTRMGFADIAHCLHNGAKNSLSIIGTCTCAGIMIGVLTLTGTALKFTQVVVALSRGNLLAAAILIALVALVLGMGLPTTAAYLICASIGAPALMEFGVSALVAHMFVFYYACLSAVTPPVALAAYAGAGMAGAPPLRTAILASRFALVTYLVPIFFVYNPALLGQGSLSVTLWTLVSALTGVAAVSIGLVGWSWIGNRKVSSVGRILVTIGGILLVKPGLMTDAVGIGLIAAGLLGQEIAHLVRRQSVSR